MIKQYGTDHSVRPGFLGFPPLKNISSTISDYHGKGKIITFFHLKKSFWYLDGQKCVGLLASPLQCCVYLFDSGELL
jgi:hypothetical protein